MLQIQYLRENTQEAIERLQIKNVCDAENRINEILLLDNSRREFQHKLDSVKAESNAIAKEIGKLFKEGKAEEAAAKKERTVELKAQEKELSDKMTAVEKELNDKLISLPNTPHISVPKGKNADDNEILAYFGEKPTLHEKAVPHWDLCSKYNIVDFELGNKITGAGFPVYKGKGAALQRALITFFLNSAVAEGFLEIQPPLMINEASGMGTGQLPDKEGQMYQIPLDGFYMIPTAEVPVTNIYRNVIVQENQFPIKHVAYSACFRREAGSYGKDVRGLNRLHQFDKVEIVVIEHPEKSYEQLETMKDYVASLLTKLNLPFRIVKLCGGDISFTSAMTYDFEVWSAAQQKWLEVSSVSNFETFQSNRMKLRFKDSDGKTRLAHTLNGSALALPRIVACILENYQVEDGIIMPDVLKPILGFDKID
jgi:seryl-tRNA synthetase